MTKIRQRYVAISRVQGMVAYARVHWNVLCKIRLKRNVVAPQARSFGQIRDNFNCSGSISVRAASTLQNAARK